MPSITLEDVPDDVDAALRRRAAAAGQTLQEYLLDRLAEEVRRSTVAEVLARIDRTGRPPLDGGVRAPVSVAGTVPAARRSKGRPAS